MKQQTSAATETKIKGRNIIDFTGKTIYVGIDVHEKDYQVAKVFDGICLGNHRMAASHQMLIDHLNSRYPGATFKCVYESCAWGFTLQEHLAVQALNALLYMPPMYQAATKRRKEKRIK